MYVDDLVSGSETVEEGVYLLLQAKKMLKEGGFNLRKFVTNSPAFQENDDVQLPVSYAELSQHAIERPQSYVENKVPGTIWDKEEDNLVFGFDEFLHRARSTPLTKRRLLQLVAITYDKLGLLCPMMVPLNARSNELAKKMFHGIICFSMICKLHYGVRSRMK